MKARFKGKTTSGFKINVEYNIKAMLINNIIYVKEKNQYSNMFITYCSIEEFLQDWDIINLN